jgi:hypothetical protein
MLMEDKIFFDFIEERFFFKNGKDPFIKCCLAVFITILDSPLVTYDRHVSML